MFLVDTVHVCNSNISLCPLILITIYHWNLHQLFVPFFDMSNLLLSYPWCYQLDFNLYNKINSQNMLISKTICFKSNSCSSFFLFWGNQVVIYCEVSHKKSIALLFMSIVLCIYPWCLLSYFS